MTETAAEKALRSITEQQQELAARAHELRATVFASHIRELVPAARYVQFEVSLSPGYQDPDYWTWGLVSLHDAEGYRLPHDSDDDYDLDDLRLLTEDFEGREDIHVWDLDAQSVVTAVNLHDRPAGETTPTNVADRQYAVIVGVRNPEQHPDGFGPMGYDEAHDFALAVSARWKQAEQQEGDRAFPYGEPFCDVRLLRSGVTASKAAENWVFDADVHEVETEIRASEINDHDRIREIGALGPEDDFVDVTRNDHGDTVLVTDKQGRETSFDIDEVVLRITTEA